jgi:hypothetical protein
MLQLPILSTRKRRKSNKNMDIERFFSSFLSLSLSLSTLFHHFHPTSKEQHSRLFYITHNSATNTSLNKRRSAVHVKKEFLSLCCQSPIAHTQSIFRDLPSRQCCFWKNVSAIKWASERTKRRRREKDKKTTFFLCRCKQMAVIMKNEWTWIYTRSARYIILRTDGRYVQ